MTRAARMFLYAMAALLVLVGISGVAAPQVLGAQLKIVATAAAGLGEQRGLMGGGFIGFGLCLLLGLRRLPLAAGLLLAIATIMAAIAAGRIVSLLLDGFAAATLAVTLGELLIAVACWQVCKESVPGDPKLH